METNNTFSSAYLIEHPNNLSNTSLLSSRKMKRGIFFIFFFSFWYVHFALSVPIISGVSAPASINKYSKYEIFFNLGNYSNPYDPSIINVSGEFTSPSGKLYSMPGFYYNQATSTCNTYETVTLSQTNKGWAVRFAPNETGVWTFKIKAKDASGTTYSSNTNFTCNASSDHGFILKANARYLKYDDGTPFYPVGDDIPWFDRNSYRGALEKGTCQINGFIDQLSTYKANSFRLEINFFDGIHIMGYDYTDSKNYLTFYNQKSCWQLDKILDYAKTKNINLFLAVFSHGHLGDAIYCDNSWSTYNPFNTNIPAANKPQAPDVSGTLNSPYGFFSDANAINIEKNLVRYIIARWGYATNIISFELMDEANRLGVVNPSITAPSTAVQDLTSWHITMKNYFNSLDPYKHLITTAFSGKDHTELPGIKNAMDYEQVHNYTNMNKYTVPAHYWNGDFEDENYNITQNFTSAYQKPVYTGETGWYNDTLGHNMATDDPKLFEYHCVMWANMFNGSMGTPAFWIHQDLLAVGATVLNNFTGIGEFVKTLPMLSENYVPNKSTTTDFRMYYLKNINQDKYYGWIQDKNFNLRNILDNYPNYLQNFSSNRPPQGTNNNIVFPVSKQGVYNLKWYNTETGALYLSQTVSSSAGNVTISFPSALRAGKYADAGFSLTYQCSGHYNASILTASAPANVVLGSDIDAYDSRNVFFVGSDNRIHVMYWLNYYWLEATLNPSASANVRANSDVAVGPAGDVFFIATDNRIHKYSYVTNQWVESALNSSYTGNVRTNSPLVVNSGGVFFIATDNKPHVFWTSGGIWNDAVLNGSVSVYASTGSDLVNNANGELYYVATDNRIHKYAYVTNQWVESTLSAGAPQNVRSDSRLTVGPSGNIYFIATDNRPHVYYGAPNWQEAQMNGNYSVFAKANSDIVCDKNTDKFYYVATDNRVHQYYWDPGVSQWIEATNNSNDPTNVSGNLAIDASGAVYYSGTDNKIYACYWDCSPYFKPVTTIEENEKTQNSLQAFIYPNPTNGDLNIDLSEDHSDIKLEIYDLKGVLLMNRQISRNETIIHINVSELNSGMYILKFNDGNTVQYSKLIKN